MTDETDVPADLPEWATFSEPFIRSGMRHIIWGGPDREHWTVRRWDDDDNMEEVGYLGRRPDGLWAFWYRLNGADAVAGSEDWRELLRLYT